MTSKNDPADFSKLKSVQPINTDPDAPPTTAWQQMKHNYNMLAEVSKNRPLGEVLCLKEALIFGKKNKNDLFKLSFAHLLRNTGFLLLQYGSISVNNQS